MCRVVLFVVFVVFVGFVVFVWFGCTFLEKNSWWHKRFLPYWSDAMRLLRRKWGVTARFSSFFLASSFLPLLLPQPTGTALSL